MSYSYDGPTSKEAEVYEMERKRWSSQLSMTPSGSHRSIYSTSYTPSHSSYVLPIVTETPDASKRPPDYLGFAICATFCNPFFGIFAILLAEKSKVYFNRCKYIKASRYGSYAYGAAAGGIACTVIVVVLAVSIVLHKAFPHLN